MKLLKSFTISFLILTIVAGYCTSLIKTSEQVGNDVFRLHILANSDSAEDQALKLKVRDYIIHDCDVFKGCTSVKDAISKAKQNARKIKESADECINKLGYSYKAKVSVVNEYFSTRVYQNITLPAGYYNSLKIEIGQGKGHNWWCIIFPSVCLSACTEDDMKKYLNDDEINMIENKNGYIVKFKSVEIYEKIKDKLTQKD